MALPFMKTGYGIMFLFEMIYLQEPRQAKNQSEKKQKENEGKIILSALC